MRRLATALGIVWLLFLSESRAAEPVAVDPQAATEFFEKKIRPLLIKRCDECHSSQKADENGNLALDNRKALLVGGTRGPVLVAGQPESSLLIKAVRYLDPNLQMPPDGKLPEGEIELLSRWIREGAHVPDYGQDLNRKSKGIDWQAARQFWSFRPVIRPEIPAVQPAAEPVRNPVDSFVRSALHRDSMTPSAPADKRTGIRRLSFDLLGLPPTPEEVAEFLADERDDAYERLVDRLLASPHFGERWARYWLDLARYVDFTPDWQKNTDRAWMYRDWIVRSFNEDRSYDEFVRQQLAADLIVDADPRDIAALGFLGVSPTYWKELKLAPSVIEVIVADEWDERLDTVSRTFLGLTVACARCHDHKFDPVSTRDYYALAGVFASTQVADRPLLPSPAAEQVLEAWVKIDALQERLKKEKDKASDEARSLQKQIDDLRGAIPNIDSPRAPVVEDSSVYVVPDGPDATKLEYRRREPRDLPVFRRGNPANPGEIVPRRFLELFAKPAGDSVPRSDSTSSESPATPGPDKNSIEPLRFQQGSGRRELADALINDAGPLTARVILNRLWLHHFGKGLVRTPGDFGQQGDRPSHPELLEWLASELMGNQSPGQRPWSLKRMHRLMVTSATYRQASAVTASPAAQAASVADPDNHQLARMNRRRLEIEPWRDAMLAVTGNLDDRMEGAGADLAQAGNTRRTLYGRIGRDEQNDMLRIYDFPPPTTHSPSRDATTTPLQQLFVFNSEFMETQATILAQRLLEPADATTGQRIERCYQLLFQRFPSDAERQLGQRFLEEPIQGPSSTQDRWRWYVQSLFGLNEFLFVD